MYSKLVSDDSPMLAQIVVDASEQISESNTDGKTLKVDLDNIKVEKKAGASIHDTKLIKGIVVGITGMGGGALMTPALIFLGVGNVSSIVTADLRSAAAIYKTGGAAVHWRCGSPNLRLAALLICSSVPMAFLGPRLVRWITPGANIDTFLMGCIGIATLCWQQQLMPGASAPS